ncbi:uncharacterized protein DKFZp434B061-like [Ornithorhynchus anatinus]|uniref:uncharacterized protein DKFZp434B061-like n=1 Tax=Ornithorhynchus anatinus TaxID=9258 RepID=UPI0010A84D38|nr:uncharacterized protein DKFZp434B061-like [Ornithorhynchus anatinus]
MGGGERGGEGGAEESGDPPANPTPISGWPNSRTHTHHTPIERAGLTPFEPGRLLALPRADASRPRHWAETETKRPRGCRWRAGGGGRQRAGFTIQPLSQGSILRRPPPACLHAHQRSSPAPTLQRLRAHHRSPLTPPPPAASSGCARITGLRRPLPRPPPRAVARASQVFAAPPPSPPRAVARAPRELGGPRVRRGWGRGTEGSSSPVTPCERPCPENSSNGYAVGISHSTVVPKTARKDLAPACGAVAFSTPPVSLLPPSRASPTHSPWRRATGN